MGRAEGQGADPLARCAGPRVRARGRADGVVLWLIRRRAPSRVNRIFRRLQLISGGFVAFTHGTNDAQKTMGIIALGAGRDGTPEPGQVRRAHLGDRELGDSRWARGPTPAAGASSGRSDSESPSSSRRRGSPPRRRAPHPVGNGALRLSGVDDPGDQRRRARRRRQPTASPRFAGASPGTSSSPGC